MRNLDPVFRTALERLEPVLYKHGLSVAAECHYPEAFGSAYVEYTRRNLRLRLMWDGRDRWLWAQYVRPEGNAHAPSESYLALETELPVEGAQRLSEALAGRRVEELAQRLDAFLGSECAA